MRKSLLKLIREHYIISIIVLIIIILFSIYIYRNKLEIEIIVNDIPEDIYLTKKKIINRKKHEKECRRIIENIFRMPFSTIRPDFLRNPETGKNLEIDMYNPNLRLGFEYQGIQHRKFCPFFHKDYQDFINQVRRDRYKCDRCKELGILLLYIPDTVKFNDLEKYIMGELKKNNIQIK